MADGVAAILHACESWGGDARPLLYWDRSGAHHGPWGRVADDVAPTYVAEHGATASWQDWDHRAPLISVLVAMNNAGNFRSVTIPDLAGDDPWRSAYLACFGDLPVTVGLEPFEFELERIRPDATYDQLLDVTREPVSGSAADFLGRLRNRETLSPFELTYAGLTSSGRGTSHSWRDGLLHPNRRRLHPVVVVYSPDSVEDLCLIRTLRAARSRRGDGPFAVPNTVDFTSVISGWGASGAFNSASGRRCVLTSASVDTANLQQIARELGDHWTVEAFGELLDTPVRPHRASTDVVMFSGGSGLLLPWSEDDRRAFGSRVSGWGGLSSVVLVRPLGRRLAPSKSLSVDMWSGYRWIHGGCETSPANPAEPFTMRWPTNWTVLEAMMRDRDLSVRPSVPGRAAEVVLAQMEDIDELALLSSPDVIKLLYRLGERQGMTWFRSKFNAVIEQLRTAGDEMAERVGALEDYLSRLTASTEDAGRHTVTAAGMRLGASREETQHWIDWAEATNLLLRGVNVRCAACEGESWIPMRDIAPPVICPGCTAPIASAFPHDQVVFRYRASSPLLKLLDCDALGHLLLFRWLVSLFDHGMTDDYLVGGYPGVEFVDVDGTVLGEADVLLVFSDGSLGLAEYKRSARGLTADEVDKLDSLADRVGASWTMVATHDSAAACGAIWSECQQVLPQRPRFVLTGDQLFSHAVPAIGASPFAAPDLTTALQIEVASPMTIAVRLAEYRRPDIELRRAWEELETE
jgi:hypothetical protein